MVGKLMTMVGFLLSGQDFHQYLSRLLRSPRVGALKNVEQVAAAASRVDWSVFQPVGVMPTTAQTPYRPFETEVGLPAIAPLKLNLLFLFYFCHYGHYETKTLYL